MTGTVSVEVTGDVAWVTLTHERKFNAMSRAMWRSLKRTFDDAHKNGELRCIVIRGAQGNFCAGGDIVEYPSFRFDAVELEKFHEEDVWGGLQSMLDCDVPIVAQIEGFCMGAGLEIASCCDIRIASPSSRFGAPIARLGFPMAPRETELVTRVVGANTARAMLLTAEMFDADYMYQRNFLLHIFGSESIATEALNLSQRISALAPQAARMNKQTFRMLNMSAETDRQAQSAPEMRAAGAYAYAQAPEHREGIDAFLNKRKPEF
jgi:enoyl-CoA hydratase/carnithine racemase